MMYLQLGRSKVCSVLGLDADELICDMYVYSVYPFGYHSGFDAAMPHHIVTAAGRLCTNAATLQIQVWCGRAAL